MYAFPFSLMYLLFCTDFYIFRNFVFFVFLVVQYRRSVIYKIKRLDTNTRDFGYIVLNDRLGKSWPLWLATDQRSSKLK